MFSNIIKCMQGVSSVPSTKDCSDHFVIAVFYFIYEDNYQSKHCLYFPSFITTFPHPACDQLPHQQSSFGSTKGGKHMSASPPSPANLSVDGGVSPHCTLSAVYTYTAFMLQQILRLTLWRKGLRCAWSGLTGPMRSSWPLLPDTLYWAAMILW